MSIQNPPPAPKDTYSEVEGYLHDGTLWQEAGERMLTQRVAYTLRFDDICPTMDWKAWDRVEELLNRFDVKPLLAVVPDNRDPKLEIAPAASDFWDRVCRWQARGWTIGLHGYQHVYVNQNPGIMGLTENSEFATLEYDVQLDKIRKGLKIFDRQGVRADCWTAPSHSFDWNTVKALKNVGIDVISDGFWHRPFTDDEGMVWVPQQIGGHDRAMLRRVPSGIWTVCCHVNGWGNAEIDLLQRDLESRGSYVVPFSAAVACGRSNRLTQADRLAAWATYRMFRLRKFVRLLKT